MEMIIKALFFLIFVQVVSGAPINSNYEGEESENSNDGLYEGEELENSNDQSIESSNEDYSLSSENDPSIEGVDLKTADSPDTEGVDQETIDNPETEDSSSDYEVSLSDIIAMFDQWKYIIHLCLAIILGLVLGLVLVSALSICLIIQNNRLKRKMKSSAQEEKISMEEDVVPDIIVQQ